MENSLSSEEIRDFWCPIPGAYGGLNIKKGPARFVYLILPRHLTKDRLKAPHEIRAKMCLRKMVEKQQGQIYHLQTA